MRDTQSQQQSDAASPSNTRFDAFVVTEIEGRKPFWTKIGAAFPHADGQGFNMVLQALPVTGKLVVRVADSKAPEDSR